MRQSLLGQVWSALAPLLTDGRNGRAVRSSRPPEVGGTFALELLSKVAGDQAVVAAVEHGAKIVQVQVERLFDLRWTGQSRPSQNHGDNSDTYQWNVRVGCLVVHPARLVFLQPCQRLRVRFLDDCTAP